MRKSRILIALMILLVTFGSGLYAGFWSADQLTKRFSLLARADRKISGYVRSFFASGEIQKEKIHTNRLDLERRTLNVPLEVADNGGGLSAAPDGGLLLIDRTGKIFHILGSHVARLNIETPDNKISELKSQFEAGAFGSSPLRFKGFRYNDILTRQRDDATDVFISYTEWFPDKRCVGNTIAQLTLPFEVPVKQWRAKKSDWRIVTRTDPCIPARVNSGDAIEGIEAGGRLALGSDDTLIWSTGVFGRDDQYSGPAENTYAQSLDGDNGKVLRVRVSTGEKTIIARGLRNPQGLSTSSNGDVWVTDHGMEGGDELNFVPISGNVPNFGFPIVSFGTQYSGEPVSHSGQHEGHGGYDLPVAAFVPSVGLGAVLFLENFAPVWDGDVLIGDFAGHLQRVHIEEGHTIFIEPIPIGDRTRDMQLMRGGEIAIWTDNLQLIFLKPTKGQNPATLTLAKIDQLKPPTQRDRVRNMFKECTQCHSFQDGYHRAGPSLYNICQRDLGSTSYASYSGALSDAGGKWSPARLAEFITHPEKVAPGTSMAWAGTRDKETAAALANIICK